MPEIRITVSEAMDKILENLVLTGLGSTKAEVARLAVAHMLVSMPDVLRKSVSTNIGFSSEGRLPQVENAAEATRKGALIAGAVAIDGVVLVKRLPSPVEGERRLELAIINNPTSRIRPIHRLAPSIAVGFTGINADGQSVLKEAVKRLSLGKAKGDVDVYQVGDELASIMHEHALDRNSRVLGVLFIVAGLDSDGTPRLLLIDPSGGLYDLKVASGGNITSKAWSFLIDAADEKGMTLDEAVKVAITAGLQGNADPEDLIVDVLDIKTRTFREIDIDEKRRYM